MQRQFELLPFGERAGVVHFANPVFQVLDLRAVLDVGAPALGIELADFGNAALDFLNGLPVALGCELFAALGAHLDQEKLGTELLQGPGEFFGFRIARHEIEHRQIACCVLDDACVIPEFEQTNVAMVKLQCFQLKLRAILRLQHKTVVTAPILHVLFQPALVKLEKREMSHRAFSVRASLGIHLEQTQIDAQLNFLLAIASRESADDDLARLIIPILEERRDIEVHRGRVWRTPSSSQRALAKNSFTIHSQTFRFSVARAIRNAAAMAPLNRELVLRHVRAALDEDIGSGDVTTLSVLPANAMTRAAMVAREEMVVCGLALAATAFQTLSAVNIPRIVDDGIRARPGTNLMEVEGPAQALLSAERVALNYVQRLSGIATLAARFVDAIVGTRATILDTRKTTPGWRELEKYAVRCGGARNHRSGLWDMVLIKDNHLAAVQDAKPDAIAAAVQRARQKYPNLKVEVEADTLEQVEQALAARADIILLDNMSVDELRAAVRLVSGRAKVEASGGVNLETVRAIAETGVDYISVGALTHSARAVDIGLDFLEL